MKPYARRLDARVAPFVSNGNRHGRGQSLTIGDGGRSGVSPAGLCVGDVDPVALARQMTLIESRLYQEVGRRRVDVNAFLVNVNMMFDEGGGGLI